MTQDIVVILCAVLNNRAGLLEKNHILVKGNDVIVLPTFLYILSNHYIHATFGDVECCLLQINYTLLDSDYLIG